MRVKRFEMYFTLARIPLDFCAALFGWWLARIVRPITDLIPGLHSFFDPKFIPETDFFLPFSLFSALGFLTISAFLGAFRFSEELNWSKEIPRTFLSSLFWGMAIISFFTMFYREVIFSRIMLMQAMIFTAVLVLFFRFFLRVAQQSFWKRGFGIIRIILLGSEKNRSRFQKIITSLPQFAIAQEFLPETDFTIKEYEEIWHVNNDFPATLEEKLRSKCHREHKVFRYAPASEKAFARIDLQVFGGIPLLRPVPASLSGWGQILKRCLDTFGSSMGLFILFPVFFLLALGIKLTSFGPIFYGSKRIGKNGKEFMMWKFRSMTMDAEKMKQILEKENHRSDSPFFKMKHDPRITVFGKFLRRFSLDELPQLWNVLKGEMSLVGSRPHLPQEIEQFSPEKKRILAIKPGLSGLAQVSGRSDLSFEEEIRLDTYYLENWSFWLDLKIFFKTILVVMKGNGAD